MVKKRKASKKKCPSNKQSNKSKNAFIKPFVDRLVDLKIQAIKEGKKELPPNEIKKVVTNINEQGVNWINHINLRKRVSREYTKRMRQSVIIGTPPPKPPGATMNTSATSIVSPTPIKKKPGRIPDAIKSHRHRCFIEARNEITDLYFEHYLCTKNGESEEDSVRKKRKKCADNTYMKVFMKVKTERNLPDDFTFCSHACMMRIYRNTVHQSTYQKQSPLHDIEPFFVEFLIRVSETGVPLSVAESLLFINSVINNTTHQQKLIAFKKHHFSQEYLSQMSDADLGSVGRNYWGAFYKRHKERLATQTAKKFELNRIEEIGLNTVSSSRCMSLCTT